MCDLCGPCVGLETWADLELDNMNMTKRGLICRFRENHTLWKGDWLFKCLQQHNILCCLGERSGWKRWFHRIVQHPDRLLFWWHFNHSTWGDFRESTRWGILEKFKKTTQVIEHFRVCKMYENNLGLSVKQQRKFEMLWGEIQQIELTKLQFKKGT